MDCVFCKIVSGQIPTKKIKETSQSISFLDVFPLTKGHVLVMPKQHCKKLQDLTTEENSDLFSLVHEVMSKVDAVTGSTLLAIHNGEGAGQEIPHVHVHLIPRSKNDSAGPIHSMFKSSLQLTESEIDEIHNQLKF